SDKGSPWTIDSGSQTFFNKNASDVIAYGEKFYTSTTGSTSNMVSFEIPLDYKALNRIPTHIIIVASASRYGDYFAGSSSSVMNIDDLELVYE
ncbi:MAG: PCMD domain-containing protein, partial [Bacteroidales bacterium]|nr:PCMD domain-containing protein [Bacteroidales bacterium]